MQPPQDPHPQFPYNSPASIPQSNAGPIRQRTVSVGVVSQALNYLTPNIGPWILVMLASFAICCGVIAFCRFLLAHLPHQSSVLGTVLAVLIQVFPWVVIQLLLGGLAKMALGTVRTRVTKISEMWQLKNVAVNLLLSAILQGILYALICIPSLIVLFIGIMIPIMHVGQSAFTFLGTGKIPGIDPSSVATTTLVILLSFLLLFVSLSAFASLLLVTIPLLVDRKAGPWGAIAESFGAMRRHFWSAFMLVLVLGLINMGGLLFCCVGVLFTIPLTQLAIALVYRDLFDIEGPIASPLVAAPPIANPNF